MTAKRTSEFEPSTSAHEPARKLKAAVVRAAFLTKVRRVKLFIRLAVVNGRSRPSRYLLRFRVIGVTFGDFCLIRSAFVNIEAMPKSDALPGGNRQVTRALVLLFKVVQAKRIGCKQPIIAHMPGRWMTWVGRMIEHRDAEGLPTDRPI